MIEHKLKFQNVNIHRAYEDNKSVINPIVRKICEEDIINKDVKLPSSVGKTFMGYSLSPFKPSIDDTNRNMEYSSCFCIYLSLPNDRAIFVETVLVAIINNSKNWDLSKFKKFCYNNYYQMASMSMPAVKRANHAIYDLVGNDESFDEIYVPDIWELFTMAIKEKFESKKYHSK